MVMDYPVHKKAVSRLRCPMLLVDDMFALYDTVGLSGCDADGSELFGWHSCKAAIEPTVDSSELAAKLMLRNVPVRPSDTDCREFFSLSC